MKIVLFEVRQDEFKEIEHQKKAHPELIILTVKDSLNKENIELLEGVDAISILAGTHCNKELLEAIASKGIKAISTRTIGYDHIDMIEAKKLGIKVTNASYAPNAVADFTVMLLLVALRKYKPAMWRQQVNDYSLSGLQGKNVCDITVGVIGTGQIGQQVIKNLSGFGCKMIAYSNHEAEEIKQYATYVSLDELYRNSDIITIHIPCTKENMGLINASSINKMKDGVILINTARGELMDIDAIMEGIETEKIGALALDVFDNDIGIYHVNHTSDILINREMAYLRQFPNVILTQHMAFYTESSVEQMVSCGIESLVGMIKNEEHPS